jgi:hypothetical protein
MCGMTRAPSLHAESHGGVSAIEAAAHGNSIYVQAAELPSQVEALLRAVNTTNDFENELAARFGDASPAEVGQDTALSQ